MNTEQSENSSTNVPTLLTLMETLDGGTPLREAETMLREIVSESYERGGKGELTLKLKFTTTLARGTPKVEARMEVHGRVPRMFAGVSTFFATADGTLRRDDPAQMELPGLAQNIVRIARGRRSPKAEPKAAPKPEQKAAPKAAAKAARAARIVAAAAQQEGTAK